MSDRAIHGARSSSNAPASICENVDVSGVSTLAIHPPWTPFSTTDGLWRPSKGGVHAVHADLLTIAGAGGCVCAHLTHNSCRITPDSVDTPPGNPEFVGVRTSTSGQGVHSGETASVDTLDTPAVPAESRGVCA